MEAASSLAGTETIRQGGSGERCVYTRCLPGYLTQSRRPIRWIYHPSVQYYCSDRKREKESGDISQKPSSRPCSEQYELKPIAVSARSNCDQPRARAQRLGAGYIGAGRQQAALRA